MDESSGESAAEALKEDAKKTLDDIKGRGIMGFFSFEHMYFPIIARYFFILICVLIIIGTSLSAVLGLVAMFGGAIGSGIGAIVGSVIFGAVGLLGVRIWFEMLLLGFTINRNLESIRDKN